MLAEIRWMHYKSNKHTYKTSAWKYSLRGPEYKHDRYSLNVETLAESPLCILLLAYSTKDGTSWR